MLQRLAAISMVNMRLHIASLMQCFMADMRYIFDRSVTIPHRGRK